MTTKQDRAAVCAFGVLMLAGCAPAYAPAQAAMSPEAVFHAYENAVNSGNVQAFSDLIDERVERSDYPRCKPAATNKQCLIAYVTETVMNRHGKLMSQSVETIGDTAYAKLQFSTDGTRAAGVQRAQGTDVVQVADGKIVAFHFRPDPNDPQTTTYFAAIRRLAAQRAAAPER